MMLEDFWEYWLVSASLSMNDFNPIQDGSFEGCSQMEGGGGGQKRPIA